MEPMRCATLGGALLIAAVAWPADALKQQAKDSSARGILDLFKLNGDVAPGKYPVLKFNQNVNNDSTFAALRKQEIQNLQEQVLRLMPQQRKQFQQIRDKLGRQTKLVDELAVAMERQ